MNIDNHSYAVTASAVLDFLQSTGRYLTPFGGITTDVTYLTPEQCKHLYKFLVPYAENLKVYNPLLEELRDAACLE